MKKNKRISFLISIFLSLAVGLTAGWLLHSFKTEQLSKESNFSALRLSGYKYINPLLACDVDSEGENSNSQGLSKKVQDDIDREINQGKITQASVYYRDILSGSTININSQEKYYPASLSKIPVMIAAFKMAQDNSQFLNKELVWDDSTDYNADQGIKPAKYLVAGQKYTIMQAIEIMIRYSDNNAFYLLSKNIDVNIFKQTFSDLKIPLREDPNSSQDFLTAKDFSYFLRVLYNGTYLNKDYSEKALELLSQVDFRNGLVAGIGNGTVVAHKFGLGNIPQNGNNNGRELHDCGIVYKAERPYLLCVMTKSVSSIDNMENAISNISKTIYNN